MAADPALNAALLRAGWDVGAQLGRSPRAAVYRVRRTADGREYAMKLSSVDGGDDLTAYRREAAILASVRHPGLPQIHEVGQVVGQSYMVMELLAGDSLGARLADGPLAVPDTLTLAREVAGALGAAHQAGLVHRDIKPDNIMFDRAGAAHVIDFGLAMVTAGETDGAVVGTLRYSAPEQGGMRGRPVDHRSDLYSLGVVLFECLTGAAPFDHTDVGELLRAHATLVPPTVSQLRPRIPPALSEIIAILLAKDPDDRYPTAAALAADLDRIVAGDTHFPPNPTGEPAAAMRDRELVGRDGELAVLHRHWDRTRAGKGRVVLLHGAPGAGSSRLARELLRTVHTAGYPVLAGHCEDDLIPYLALREAIDTYLRGLRAGGGEDPYGAVRAAAGQSAGMIAPLSQALAEALGQEAAGIDDVDRFASAVADFLLDLARGPGGAVLFVDDVHRLDDPGRLVLQRLLDNLAEAPLLLVATAPDENLGALAWLRDCWGRHGVDLAVPALTRDAVERLLAGRLGGVVDPAFVTRVTSLSDGNAYAVGGYAQALLDAGLVSPHWGRVAIDLDGIDAVSLPTNVSELLARQVDQLGDARDVLRVAAAFGQRFRLDLLVAACDLPSEQVVAAISTAAGAGQARARLVEPLTADRYAFVHDTIPDLLLADVDPARLRAVHQRIALLLGDRPLTAMPAQDVYELAYHHARGDVEQTPDRAFAAGWAAARAAVADAAATEALEFLAAAEHAARIGGIEWTSDFDATVSTARYLAGDLDGAAERANRALAATTDLSRRVELFNLLARIGYAGQQYVAMLAACRDGLAEVGQPVPRTTAHALGVALSALFRSLIRLHPRAGFGAAGGPERQRHLDHLRLSEISGRAAYFLLSPATVIAMTLRFFHSANRLGPAAGAYFVETYLTVGLVAAIVGLHRAARWLVGRAEAAARQHRDPGLVAQTAVMNAHLEAFRGQPVRSMRALCRVVAEQGRWLPSANFIEVMSALATLGFARGLDRDCIHWREQAIRRGMRQPTPVPSSVVVGEVDEPEQQLDQARRYLADEALCVASGPAEVSTTYGAAMNVLVERGDPGELFDRLCESQERFGKTTATTGLHARYFWMIMANGRLAQAHEATGADRPDRIAQARIAVKRLRQVARRDPLMTGHALVARAALALVEGRRRGVADLLDRADRFADECDAPLIRFAQLRERARLRRVEGNETAAVTHARAATALAVEHYWPYRANAVRREFTLEAEAPSAALSRHSRSGAENLRNQRYLDALLQVSLAAATVLDPRELARVALDEILLILGAERAFLFLAPEEGPLERYAGRDAEGNDLDTLVGYSSTVIERARIERQPVIVTGTEQGEAAGSHSAVVHGLRSIMVAPLQLEGRLLGVVYLDSRVAKGIFAAEDAGVLVAMANHIAISLENARAAQLEVTVQAERRRRNLADALRDATTELSRTLDPAEVLSRGAALAAGMIDADTATILHRDGDVLRVVTVHGATGPAEPGVLPVATVDGPPLHGLTEPVVGGPDRPLPEPLPAVLGNPARWLALPLSIRESVIGVLLLGHRRSPDDPAANLGVAAAFAGQIGVAYDNARLFRQVTEQATTDALTGISNRRHLLEQASRELTAARRRQRPLAAIMLDIDHFKRINDTYGHLAGDEVIRTVASRLAGAVRHEDLVGRYGGEEFALAVHGGEADAGILAERLRAVVAAEPVMTADGPVPVTISVGVSMLTPEDSSFTAVLARADTALYRAKQDGRNRVALSV